MDGMDGMDDAPPLVRAVAVVPGLSGLLPPRGACNGPRACPQLDTRDDGDALQDALLEVTGACLQAPGTRLPAHAWRRPVFP